MRYMLANGVIQYMLAKGVVKLDTCHSHIGVKVRVVCAK